mgnify:CR=1 FL=1
MLLPNEEYRPIKSVPRFIWQRVEHGSLTTRIGLFGRLTAYLPHAKRPHYTWAIAVSYAPAKPISTHEFRPPLLQARLFSRWEFGLVLGNWLLGLRLRQPLIWVKHVRARESETRQSPVGTRV